MTIDTSELMIILMKSRSLHNRIKKDFMIFFTLTLRTFINYHSPTYLPSHNITKNAETHPPPKRHIIIEQSHWKQILQIVSVSNSTDSPIFNGF